MFANNTDPSKKVVVLGDFNITPGSNALNLLFNKDSQIEEVEFYQDNLEVILQDLRTIRDNFDYRQFEEYRFRSVYEDYTKIVSKKEKMTEENNSANKGYPEFSNYTQTFKDFIDHIFLNFSAFPQIQSIKRLPTILEVEAVQPSILGFPNEVFPSDHFALGVDV